MPIISGINLYETDMVQMICLFVFSCSMDRLLKLGDVAILLLQMTVPSALWSTSEVS